MCVTAGKTCAALHPGALLCCACCQPPADARRCRRPTFTPPRHPLPPPSCIPIPYPPPQVLEATRELITEANFEVTTGGISLQAMDSSHVSLVALTLRSDGFEHFRCDRTFSMGMNLNNMAKMLKCAANDDSIHMKAEDGGDTVAFTFESPSA